MGTIKGHESNALLTCLSIPCVFTFIVFSLCATLLCIDAKTIYDPILCYQYVHSSYGLVILSISLLPMANLKNKIIISGDERIDFKQQMRCLLMGVLSVCIGELLFIVISNVIDMSFNTTTFDGKTYQKYTEMIHRCKSIDEIIPKLLPIAEPATSYWSYCLKAQEYHFFHLLARFLTPP